MQQPKENKMGTMPEFKLLLNMALPMMASMLIQALYNIVDSMFVARLAERDMALTALSLAFPIQMLLISVSSGTGVGINAMLARKLGEKRPEEASAVARNGLILGALSSLVFAAFGIFGTRAYLSAFTTDPVLTQMGSSYIAICCICSFGVMLTITLERIIQATGRTVYSMLAQMAGAISNIILDPIFIFGLFGVPAMGVAGAAIATALGQLVSLGAVIYFNLTKNHDINFSFKGFKPDLHIIKEIYRVGLPSILMQSIGSVMTVGMNRILIGFSETAVLVFGIYFKLQSFIFMPVFGLTNSMIPVISYNYGARSRTRITNTIKLAMMMAGGVMVVGTVIFQVAPQFMLTTMFNASPEMLAVGVPALKIISICFIPAAVTIVFSSSFQAMGYAVYSLIMSIARQLVIILPAAWILGKTFGLDATWAAFPIAEIGAMFMAVLMYQSVYKTKIKTLD